MASDMDPRRRQEQEAVRTTIVGGRPPGCGQSTGNIPRGIEVLVKKAAVDPEFRSLLLSKRGEAAKSIGLALSAAESMMLSAVPVAQLQSIIDATTVPPPHVPAFLGKVAAVMLAALGIVQCGCDDSRNASPAGVRPEDNPKETAAVTTRPAAPAGDQPLAIAGAVVVKPLTRPATEPTEPIPPVAGVRPLPGIAGERIDRPPDPATQPATQPAATQPPQNITILGLMIDRPQDAVIRGIRADTPRTAPATQPTTRPPATQPPATQPPQNIVVYGMMVDRPQDTVIRGLRVDTPRTAPATQPASQPAAEAEPAPPVYVFGARPAVIKGIRVDRPDTPTTSPATSPTTQPTTQPVQPQPPIIVAGISPAPPPDPRQEGK